MNQYLIFAIVAALLFAAGGATGWHERVLREPKMIEDQQKADVAQCNAEKLTTKEATDALQKNRDDLARRLSALKLQRPARCVNIARTTDVQHSEGRPAGRDGLSSDWLYTYAAEQCSSYWRQLKVCDKFLDDERKVIAARCK